MLFINEDNFYGNDSVKVSWVRIKVGDFWDIGIFFDLMYLKKFGGFDIFLFYRDIISIVEDEDFRVYFEEFSKLEDLLWKVCVKEIRKWVFSRLKLKFNKDIVIFVGVYNLV